MYNHVSCTTDTKYYFYPFVIDDFNIDNLVEIRIPKKFSVCIFIQDTSPRFLCRPTAFCSTCWSRGTSERSP